MRDERKPTVHEQRAGRPWDASYHDDGPAPWDIGRPQPAVVRLAGEGAFAGAVLDAGCGTGENALHLAELGRDVLGVDVAETAVAIAREKAARRGVHAEFDVADALHLDRLGRTFDTVLDCGLFHSFEGEEWAAYAASLQRVTRPGSTVHVLCFSDADPEDSAPHPVSEQDLRAAFAAAGGWQVVAIGRDRLEMRLEPGSAPALVATIERL